MRSYVGLRSTVSVFTAPGTTSPIASFSAFAWFTWMRGSSVVCAPASSTANTMPSTRISQDSCTNFCTVRPPARYAGTLPPNGVGSVQRSISGVSAFMIRIAYITPSG